MTEPSRLKPTGQNRTAHTPEVRHPGLVLAVIVTCQMMLIVDVTVMNVALPAIQRSLHFSATGLSWVINAYTLAYGGLLLLGGRAGDLFGRRRLFLGGIALFTAASLLGGLSTGAAWLLAARVSQGIAAAVAGPTALALLATTFTEPRARIRALSIFSAVASGGLALGLVVGGALTEWLSWRGVLFINVPFGIAVLALAPRLLAETPRRVERLDLPGAVTVSGGAALLVYAFIRAATAGWADAGTLSTLTAALLLLASFVLIESRTARPLLPLRLFADRNRGLAYLEMLLLPAAMFAMFYFLTQFLQNVLGFSPLRTGFAFLPMAVAMFTLARSMPRLLPRFGAKPLILLGNVFIAVGIGILTRIDVHTGYFTGVFGPMVLFGMGGGLVASALNVTIMSAVPAPDTGAASGALQSMQQIGGSLGLAVLVSLFGRSVRHAGTGTPVPEVLVHGIAHAYRVATVFACVAIVVALFLRRSPRPAPARPAVPEPAEAAVVESGV